MRPRPFAFLALTVLSLAACAGNGNPPSQDLAASDSGAPADLAPADLALPADTASPAPDLAEAPDLTAPPDLARAGDLAARRCASDRDCRLFSSYCSTDPCVCFALPADAVDPVCNGNIVLCFADPCTDKVAICDPQAGTCVVK